jgi:hypothetical protein
MRGGRCSIRLLGRLIYDAVQMSWFAVDRLLTANYYEPIVRFEQITIGLPQARFCTAYRRSGDFRRAN